MDPIDPTEATQPPKRPFVQDEGAANVAGRLAVESQLLTDHPAIHGDSSATDLSGVGRGIFGVVVLHLLHARLKRPAHP